MLTEMLANCDVAYDGVYCDVMSMLDDLENVECCHVASNKDYIFTVCDKKALNLIAFKILIYALSDSREVSGAIPSLCINQIFNNFVLDAKGDEMAEFERRIERDVAYAPGSVNAIFEIATLLSNVAVFEEMVPTSLEVRKRLITGIADYCAINSEEIDEYNLSFLYDIISLSGKGLRVRRTIRAFARLGYMFRWFEYFLNKRHDSCLTRMLKQAVCDYLANIELGKNPYECEVSFWDKFFEEGITSYKSLAKEVKSGFKFADELCDVMVMLKDGKSIIT